MGIFKFKSRGRECSSKFYRLIEEWLKPKIVAFSQKNRLHARMRLLLKWGNRHPGKVVMYYALFAVFILLLNLSGLFFVSGKSESNDPLGLKGTVEQQNVFNGMRTINANREMIQESVEDYARESIRLSMELDSLLNLRKLTKEDSLQIYTIYQKLKQTSNIHEPKTN